MPPLLPIAIVVTNMILYAFSHYAAQPSPQFLVGQKCILQSFDEWKC